MQRLTRNLKTLAYLPYTGVTSDLTDNNEHTGEFHRVYGDPVIIKGNISSPSGRISEMFYGQDVRYTHTLVLDGTDTGVTEDGLIRWNGELYDIQAIRPTLNATSVALRKQTTDHESEWQPPINDDGDAG